MDVLPSIAVRENPPCVTFVHMEDKKRAWVRITDDTKRKMTHLSVDAGAKSVEEYGGDLLSSLVDSMWAKFDPKRNEKMPRKGK